MKYAFVTGSSKGIGLAIGCKLLDEGFHVVFNYSRDAGIHEVLQNSKYDKNSYSIIKYDNTDTDNIDDLLTELHAISSTFHVIVFNAGITLRGSLEDITKHELNRIFNCNVFFPTLFLGQARKLLAEDANVIFMGSAMGIHPHSFSLPYGVSKAAVNALTQNLLKFYEETNIRVNCVNPGFVETQWQKNKPESIRKRITDKIAAGRFAEPEEVASLVYHIISNKYINGSQFTIDGGYSFK